MRVPLDESTSGSFGGDGVCRISAGPAHPAHSWELSWATVSSDSVAETIGILETSAGGNLGGTRSGNQDTTDLPGLRLDIGQRVIATWRGGTPGARCVLSVFGSLDIKGR